MGGAWEAYLAPRLSVPSKGVVTHRKTINITLSCIYTSKQRRTAASVIMPLPTPFMSNLSEDMQKI